MCARSKETLWPTTSLSCQSCLVRLLLVSRGMRSDRVNWLDQVYRSSNSRLLHHEYLGSKHTQLCELKHSFQGTIEHLNPPSFLSRSENLVISERTAQHWTHFNTHLNFIFWKKINVTILRRFTTEWILLNIVGDALEPAHLRSHYRSTHLLKQLWF